MRDGTIGQEYVFFSFMLLFLYSPLFIFSIFYFSECPFFSVENNNRQGGAGRDGTDAGGNSNTERVEGGGQRVHMLLFFCSCFSAFILFFVSLFCVSDYLFSDKYINRRGTNAKRRPDGTGYKRAAIATWDGTEGADGATGTSSFIFASCRLSSFILIILLLFRLSLFQWSITTGGPIHFFFSLFFYFNRLQYNNRQGRAGRGGETWRQRLHCMEIAMMT